MVVIGIDAHKRSHPAVIIDGNGRKLATKTRETTSKDHLSLLRWAAGHGEGRVGAIEDCRTTTRRLERDLLAAGERLVRVPPKLMAHARDAARTYGKSDPIDASAVARAALREDGPPTAYPDGARPRPAAAGRSPRRPDSRTHPGDQPAPPAPARPRP